MNASPMSITPAESAGGTPPERDEPDSFRRTSLAIAAARRFTLYEAVAASPTSPISSLSPNARVHFGDREPPRSPTSPTSAVPISVSPPSPTAPRRSGPFGSSFGGSFFSRSSGPPARYPSPLQEGPEPEDEESALGAGAPPGTSYSSAHAHQVNVAAHSPLSHSRRFTSVTSTPAASPGLERPSPRRRRSSLMATRYRWLSGGSNTGDEPGVDVRSQRDQEAYGHLKGKTHITVVDYCCDADVEDSNVRVDFPGERVGEWLRSKAGQRPMQDGKPSGVRWIHVSGVNWEVIKTLTLHYGLHPLAVEDALRSGRSPRSKCDFYANHLYLQILVYHIHAPDRAALARVAEGIPEGVGVGDLAERDDGRDSEAPPVGIPPRKRWRWWKREEGAIRLPEGIDSVFEPSGPNDKHIAQEENRLVIERLSASYMVPIRRGILSVFMLRDGTLISLSAHEIHEALAPIYERLEDENSLLRRSNDVSMLCHALLDVSVDLSVEITQAFEAEILKVEAKVLVHAQLELVRLLHIIQAQILRFRRQVNSLLHACYVLRDQDTQRAIAAGTLTQPRARGASDISCFNGQQGHGPSGLASGLSFTPNHSTAPGTAPGAAPGSAQSGVGMQRPPMPPPMPPIEAVDAHHSSMMSNHLSSPHMNSPRRPSTPHRPSPPPAAPMGVPTVAPAPAVGWFTPLARVYMNDVIDRLEMVVSSSEQYVGTCDHLTDYCFNVLSFHTNNSMERLSIVTVVFLPLTFIASYFGMNFEEFPSLDNPDYYFWRVAAPTTIAFFLIFSYSYLCSAWDTFMRRMARARQRREVAASKKRE